jgi:hypothetical protein
MRRLFLCLPLIGLTLGGYVSIQTLVAQTPSPAVARDADGRWQPQLRPLTASDVPAISALRGVVVGETPDGRSTAVFRVNADSPLHVGDRIDEIQNAGLSDREHQANPGYWPYQVWTTADFYRLAAQCVPDCLVRLRDAEGAQRPRAFGYQLIGSSTGFRETTVGNVTAYVDVRTGEHFSPLASAVLPRHGH